MTPLTSLQELSRVVVVGTSCSGKTTFARHLSERLGHPHVELDALHWGPNWTERPRDEFREAVSRAVSADRWIIDGNYGAVRDLIWPRATAIVWLNYPFGLVFRRALRRTVTRIIRREELFAGNRESFRMAFFSRESILWWVISTHRARRERYRALITAHHEPHFVVWEFARPAEAEAFLSSIERQYRQGATV